MNLEVFDMTHRFGISGTDPAWNPIPQSPGTASTPVPTDRGQQPYRLAKWKAEPGIYERPQGMGWNETFVVYAGRGRLRTPEETVELLPGVAVDLRKGAPYVLEIDEPLEKFAVITLE